MFTDEAQAKQLIAYFEEQEAKSGDDFNGFIGWCVQTDEDECEYTKGFAVVIGTVVFGIKQEKVVYTSTISLSSLALIRRRQRESSVAKLHRFDDR